MFCCSQKSMRSCCPDSGGDRIAVTYNRELERRFADWEPRVRKIIDLADQVTRV